MIRHKKVSSAAAPSDVSVVGGPDWNDDHAYGLGSIIPLAHIIAQADDDTGENIGIEVLGAQPASTHINWFGHTFTVTFDVIDVAVPEGCVLSWFLSGENYRLYTNEFFRVLSIVNVIDAAPSVQVIFQDSSGEAKKMQESARWSGTLCAVVVADSVDA